MKQRKEITVLTNAIFHCRYGSNPDNTLRAPDANDDQAAEIMMRLRREIVNERGLHSDGSLGVRV